MRWARAVVAVVALGVAASGPCDADDAVSPAPQPKPWVRVIANPFPDDGGSVAKYLERYRMLVEMGATFRIDGRCRSACTLVLIWADRVCVTERAALGFHQVSVWDKYRQPVKSESDRLMSLYPAPVREYISARGGLPPPGGTMWVSGSALRGLVKPCE